MNTVQIQHGKTRMIAHRGVSGLEKENTMSAFVAAGNRSYWGVETDVYRTLDGKMILIHDNTLKRLAGLENIQVEQTDFDTLRSIELLDCEGNHGRADLRMPSLKEYIRVCKKYGKVCVLELKSSFTEKEIGKIIGEFREEDYLDQAVFIAFDSANLLHVRRLCPSQPVQQLSWKLDEELFALLREQQFDLDIDYRSLTEDWMYRLKDCGIEVNCWTVNDPAVAEQLISWGVDYLTSNILE